METGNHKNYLHNHKVLTYHIYGILLLGKYECLYETSSSIRNEQIEEAPCSIFRKYKEEKHVSTNISKNDKKKMKFCTFNTKKRRIKENC